MLFSTNDFVKIYEAYSEPHRKYHNFNHIVSMLNNAKKVNYELLDAQEAAIFLHDVVYKIGSPDNEMLSAEYALDLLNKYKERNYSSATIEKTILCILSTKNHKPLCDLANMVIDLDLSCFCFDYSIHMKNIYDEFIPIYGEEAFFEGRINFLKSMRDRESIYCTEKFKFYEDVARINICDEMKALEKLMRSKDIEGKKWGNVKQEKIGTEEGDVCGREGCDGIIGYELVKNCTCHINPPCASCVDNPLVCKKCGIDLTE